MAAPTHYVRVCIQEGCVIGECYVLSAVDDLLR